MKYFIIMMLITMQAQGGGISNRNQIQEQLKATPQMSDRCIRNIDYYSKKITRYELKVHLNSYQEEVLKYYKTSRAAWEDYCYGDGKDPEFQKQIIVPLNCCQ